MKIICAWCQKLIRNDNDADWCLVSYSICKKCYKIEMDKFEKEVADDQKRQEEKAKKQTN